MSTIRQMSGLLIFFVMLAVPFGLPAAGPADTPSIQKDIEQRLLEQDSGIHGSDIPTRPELLEVYQAHEFSPFWTDPNRLKELLELVRHAVDHGLLPADYNVSLLQQVLREPMAGIPGQIDAGTDILLTESLLRYAEHRRFGKTQASHPGPHISIDIESAQRRVPAADMETMLDSASLADFIQAIAPMGPVYRQLLASLRRYRDIADRGGWPTVPEGPALRPGDDDARVTIIRQRLAASGHIDVNHDLDSTLFDPTLEEAVKAFQSRHQLEQDGIVGEQTTAAMNVPVEHRIDQLRLSLERLRWVNQEAADTLLMVNVAGFSAFFYREGVPVWDTRVMVGRDYRQTPVIRSDIGYLEFNPFWTIPPIILRHDTLPVIKRNPGYLAANNIHVIDHKGEFVDPSSVDWKAYSTGIPFTLRQDPGPGNPLGAVKFVFPNRHSVFLHDTPHRELFLNHVRDFSSGCIRVEDPLRLAELVLNDPVKYNRSALESIVASGETRRVPLSPKVPIAIVYLTAGISADGQTHFYRDIYGRDRRVLDALNEPVMLQTPRR